MKKIFTIIIMVMIFPNISKSQIKSNLGKNIDFAVLAKDVYNLGWKGKSVGEWTIIDYRDDGQNKVGGGFTGAIYQNNATGKIIVSYGGTTAGERAETPIINGFEWIPQNRINSDIIMDANLLKPNGAEPDQITFARSMIVRAEVLARESSKKLGFVPQVSITGHSLGGALAQYAAMYSGYDAVTFNSAPATLNIKANSKLKYGSEKILNFRTTDDPLSNILELAERYFSGVGYRQLLTKVLSQIEMDIPDFSRKYVQSRRLVSGDAFDVRADFDYIYEDIPYLLNLIKRINGIPSDIKLTKLSNGNNLRVEVPNDGTLAGGHSMSNILDEAFKQIGWDYGYWEKYGTSPCTIGTCRLDPPKDKLTTPTEVGKVANVWGGEWSGIQNPSSNPSLAQYLWNDGAEARSVTNGQAVELRATVDNTSTPVTVNPANHFGDYKYTAWGEWSGSIDLTPVLGGNGQYGRVSRGHWVLGQPTIDTPAFQTFLNSGPNNGRATYNGTLMGNFLPSGGGAQYNIMGGQVQIVADFKNGSLSGGMDVTKNGVYWSSAYFSNISIYRVTLNNNLGTAFAFNGNQRVNGDSSHLSGAFYGPLAEEVGGGWNILRSNGEGAVGVFRAKR